MSPSVKETGSQVQTWTSGLDGGKTPISITCQRHRKLVPCEAHLHKTKKKTPSRTVSPRTTIPAGLEVGQDVRLCQVLGVDLENYGERGVCC